MVWGCFCPEGPGYVYLIKYNMKKEGYQVILASNFIDLVEFYGHKVEDKTFQNDNDPKYSAKSTTKWLVDSSINILIWPS